MTEAEFSRLLKAHLIKKNYIVYKIPDPTGGGDRTARRLCDWILIKEDRAAFIELKLLKINNKDKFNINLRKLQIHQVESLLALHNQGFPNVYVIFGIQSNKTNRLLGFKVLDIPSIKEELKEGLIPCSYDMLDYFYTNKTFINKEKEFNIL